MLLTYVLSFLVLFIVDYIYVLDIEMHVLFIE